MWCLELSCCTQLYKSVSLADELTSRGHVTFSLSLHFTYYPDFLLFAYKRLLNIHWYAELWLGIILQWPADISRYEVIIHIISICLLGCLAVGCRNRRKVEAVCVKPWVCTKTIPSAIIGVEASGFQKQNFLFIPVFCLHIVNFSRYWEWIRPFNKATCVITGTEKHQLPTKRTQVENQTYCYL